MSLVELLPFAGVLILSPLLLFYLFPLESRLRELTSWKLFDAHPSKAVKDYLTNAQGLIGEGLAKVCSLDLSFRYAVHSKSDLTFSCSRMSSG